MESNRKIVEALLALWRNRRSARDSGLQGTAVGGNWRSHESLSGNYFHSLDDKGKIHWQGVVVANPEPGWYLIQLLDWLVGEPSVRRLVQIQDMATWLFYEDGDAMKHSYDQGTAREGGPYRDRATTQRDMEWPHDHNPEDLTGLPAVQ